MIDFIKFFRQIDGIKIRRATASDVTDTVNNIADCADSKAASNAFFESKLFVCSWKMVIISLKNTILEYFW